MFRSSKAHLAVLGLALLVWSAAWWWPGRAPVWGTHVLQFIPWRVTAWRAWWAGQGIPWWNPNLGLGAPLVANLQLAWFYPPAWLLGLLYALGRAEALAWGHGLLLVLHLAWAAGGMFRLVRALNLPAPAPGVAAAAYAFSGYLLTRAEVFPSMNAATAWLPWVLLAGWRLVQQPTTRTAATLAISVALLVLAGHAQTAWYTLLLLALWLAFWGKSTCGRGWPHARACFRALLLAGGLTLLLTAPQIVPTAEYLLLSARSQGVSPERAFTYSLWPWRLLGLLAPNLFGSPVTGDYWGYGAYYEDALYVGLLALGLALGTLPWLRRAPAGLPAWVPGLVRWAWAVVLVALLLALGRNTPVFPWLYAHVPTFAMFQAPTRWSLLAVFGLALLAGLRAAHWEPPGPRARYGLNLALAAAPSVALLAGVATLVSQGRAYTMARALAWAGVWATGAVALARFVPRSPARRRAWALAVVAWLTLDLVVSHWGWAVGTQASLYAPLAEPPQPAGRVYFPPEDEYALKFADFFRMDNLRPARPWRALRRLGLPNVRLLDDVATWNNFDPLLPARYARLAETLERVPPGARERVLDRTVAVAEIVRTPETPQGYRVLPRQPEPFVQWFPREQGVADAHAAWRALWTRAAQGGPGWGRQITVEVIPLDTAVRARAVPVPVQRPRVSELPSPGQVLRVTRPRAEVVVVQVAAAQAGWLLVAEQAYPGWRAWVNGEPAPVYRAEYTLMAVPVPAGAHQVVLAYQPGWWPGVGYAALLGLGLTVIAWQGGARPGARGRKRAARHAPGIEQQR